MMSFLFRKFPILAQNRATGAPKLPPPPFKDAAADTKQATWKMIAAAASGPTDPAWAAGWIKAAAEAGDAEAMVAWADALLTGRGVQPDPREAERWLRIAAAAGFTAAAERLGAILAERGGHRAEALELLRAAAAAGRPEAAFRVGHLLWGHADEAPEEIFAAFSAAAAGGHPEGTMRLGFCHAQGVGCREDAAEAFRCFEKAAFLDDSRAKYEAGRCCEDGAGVTRNIGRAVGWYGEAAREGNAAAARRFAYLRDLHPAMTTQEGDGRAARRDYETALRLGPSAQDRTETAKLMLTSADPDIAARGRGVLIAVAGSGKAPHLYLAAGGALAAGMLEEAGTWLRRAAAQGDTAAAGELAALIGAGKVKPADQTEADRLRRMAGDGTQKGGSPGRRGV